jgi:hypothetical protein
VAIDPQTGEELADERAEDLTDELARKYDPERMLKMVARSAGRGERLEHSVRSRYEKRFGVDLGHVRVFSGEFAEEFNRKRNAYAVTIGSTGMILMGGSPEKSMGSTAGQALLAHELTHVAQAQRGMHRSASFDGGMPFAQEHEAEAEHQEQAVAQETAGGDGGKDAGAEQANQEELIQQIKDRVFEMAADSARNQSTRNAGTRRRA